MTRKVHPMPDGDVLLRNPFTGEWELSHRFVNVGVGRFIDWVCANCGVPRDE